jgi:hypothetical protein
MDLLQQYYSAVMSGRHSQSALATIIIVLYGDQAQRVSLRYYFVGRHPPMHPPHNAHGLPQTCFVQSVGFFSQRRLH